MKVVFIVCYHPLKAFKVGINSNGRDEYKITNYNVDHLEINSNKLYICYNAGITKYTEKVLNEYVTIPCGKCIGCRLDYAHQWADRCYMEMKYHKDNYFLTLTYDDEHLPPVVNYDTGELMNYHSLRKRDFQLFMKRLRKEYAKTHAERVRFFAAGEYGGNTARPHYHAILFGLELEDLKFYKYSRSNPLYTSDFINSLWGLGYVVISQASYETCGYIARYCTKKVVNDFSDLEFNYGLEKEFLLMSRRPGIGRFYLDDHPDIFDYDCIFLGDSSGSKKIYPCKYFKRVLRDTNPDKYNERRLSSMSSSDNIYNAKLDQTSDDYLDMLAKEEKVLINRIRSLHRNNIR